MGFKDGRTSKQRKQGKFQKRWVLVPDKPARRVVERDHGGREADGGEEAVKVEEDEPF